MTETSSQGSARNATQQSDAATRQQQFLDQHRQSIEDLEVPVLQVWDGVLALPIIGSVDTARSQKITEALLQKIVDTGSEIVLIDITGVPVIDTAVAKHLLETASAARLLGAEVLVVGLGTTAAMTLVHLGLDLGGITTRTTLAKGLQLAFNRLGIQVSKRTAPISQSTGIDNLEA